MGVRCSDESIGEVEYAPEVGVEGLQLGEVTIEGRYVLRPDTPERANFQDVAYQDLSTYTQHRPPSYARATAKSSKLRSPDGSKSPFSINPSFNCVSNVPHFFRSGLGAVNERSRSWYRFFRFAIVSTGADGVGVRGGEQGQLTRVDGGRVYRDASSQSGHPLLASFPRSPHYTPQRWTTSVMSISST